MTVVNIDLIKPVTGLVVPKALSTAAENERAQNKAAIIAVGKKALSYVAATTAGAIALAVSFLAVSGKDNSGTIATEESFLAVVSGKDNSGTIATEESFLAVVSGKDNSSTIATEESWLPLAIGAVVAAVAVVVGLRITSHNSLEARKARAINVAIIDFNTNLNNIFKSITEASRIEKLGTANTDFTATVLNPKPVELNSSVAS